MSCLLSKVLRSAFLALGVLCCKPLHGEVQTVMVRWEGRTCQDSCMAGLQKQFEKIPGVAEVTMEGQGQATLRWKPRAPFRFQDINYAIRAIGVGFNSIWVSVRGTISTSGKKVILDSLGDETKFELLSPIQIQGNNTNVVNQSIYSYTIDEATRQQLIYNAETFRLVTVRGRMLEPFRSPPNYLIIESMEATSLPQGAAPAEKWYQKGRPSLRDALNPPPVGATGAGAPTTPVPQTGSAIPSGATQPLVPAAPSAAPLPATPAALPASPTPVVPVTPQGNTSKRQTQRQTEKSPAAPIPVTPAKPLPPRPERYHYLPGEQQL